MRKVLSFVLVLSLVLSSFSFAFAAEVDSEIAPVPEDVAGTSYETAVQVLMALDVVTGYEDGNYKPENAVTRAEMAALIVRVLGLADSADYMRASSFSDMAGHWADKYVAVMAGKNIVNGYPDGSFQPDEQVSFPEAITMVVRALGYIDGCEDLVGSWPVNYVSLADDLDITDDTDVILSGAADRGAVAQMLYNSLAVPNVSVDSDMSVSLKGEEDDRVSFLTKLDCYLDDDYGTIDPDIVGDEDYTLIDLTDYVYADVDVYRLDDGDDPIIAIDDINSDFVKGQMNTDPKEAGGYDTTVVTLANGKEIEIPDLDVDAPEERQDDIMIYLNGEETAYNTITGLNDLLDFWTVSVYGELDGDEMVTVSGIIATAATSMWLVDDNDLDDIEDAIEDGNGEVMGIELPTVDDDEEELDLDDITVVGAASSLEEIEENDAIYIYASGNKTEPDKVMFEVGRNSKDIKVKKASSDTKKLYDTDGNLYEFSGWMCNYGTFNVMGGADWLGIKGYHPELYDTPDEYWIGTDEVYGDFFEPGNTYTLYFDPWGYVYGAEEIDSTPDLYAIVVDYVPADGFDDPQIKLFTNDGDTVTFDADEDDIDDTNIVSGGEWQSVVTGAVVSYSLDSSDTIDEMNLVITDSSITDSGIYSEKSDKWSRNSLDSSVVIFDVSDDDDYDIDANNGDDSDWDIMDGLKDDDEYGAYYYKNSDGDIEVMVVLSKTSDDSEYFAVNKIYEIKDGDDEKLELEGFLGETAANEIAVDRDVVSTEAYVYVVTYDGSEIDEATMIRTDSAIIDGYGTVTDTESYGFDEDSAYAGDFADDVVVYVQVYDDHDPDAIEVGDVGDIDTDDFVIYTYDSDGDIEMVFVVDEDDVDDYEADMATN